MFGWIVHARSPRIREGEMGIRLGKDKTDPGGCALDRCARSDLRHSGKDAMLLSWRDTMFCTSSLADPRHCSPISLREGRALGGGIEREKCQDERNRDEKSDQIDPAIPESFQLVGICNVFSSGSFVNETPPWLKGAAATYVPRTTEE